jgi:NAD(P)-dependent dehydrogenase (short-subunit alcohol dehydrogenase family)
MQLEGKVAVITGAGGGIGRAAALLFAGNGAALVLTDLNPESGQVTQEKVAASGARSVFVQGNVGDSRDVQAIVDAALSEFGRIDVLFNNAGSSHAAGDLRTVTDEDIELSLSSNLKSVIYGCRAALPSMIANGGGTIVNTASITGMRGQDGRGVYGAAKAGVINFTRYLAWEYGPMGIRANAVCPGAIDTPMMRKHTDNPTHRPMLAYFENQAPLHRLGRPEDIAKTALYLASDSSSHVTGQAIAVDGGMSAGTFLDPARLRAMAADILGDGG